MYSMNEEIFQKMWIGKINILSKVYPFIVRHASMHDSSAP